jgi:hypothetical protein
MNKHRMAALCLAMLTASGCATSMSGGGPAGPLSVKRDEPGVILCASERTGGGIRLVGKLNEGLYPITNVTLQYRLADFSDAPPALPGSGGLQLTDARTAKGTYRKGSKEVSYSIDADAARAMRGKVLWYRWIVTYEGGVDTTDIHRTSLDEAGLPRAATTPGPDTSIALPVSRRR